jgi:hypothetical protein
MRHRRVLVLVASSSAACSVFIASNAAAYSAGAIAAGR